MKNIFRRTKTESKSRPSLDTGSEIDVRRSTGGVLDKDYKMISITMKSKTESIDSLLKNSENYPVPSFRRKPESSV